MAATVKVVKHVSPSTDDSSNAGTYAKAVSDAVGTSTGAVTSVASAWDPTSSSVITTIVIHDG